VATVETPAQAGVPTFAPFLRAGFQTRGAFTMKTGGAFTFDDPLFAEFLTFSAPEK
jgi:hypothetical protein